MNFGEWLYQEIDSRGMSMREFARRAGVSHSAITKIASGERQAGVKVCNAIAKTLRLPQDEVMRKAGLLKPKMGDSDKMDVKELWSIIQDMDPQQLREARRYLRYLTKNDHTPIPENATN